MSGSNAGKTKLILLSGEERLEHVSEFKYLGCVLDESSTDEAECSRKVARRRRVAGAIRSMVNALQLECARVLHKSLLVPVLTYGSETMIRREKERSRNRAVQMDNLMSAGYQENG